MNIGVDKNISLFQYRILKKKKET